MTNLQERIPGFTAEAALQTNSGRSYAAKAALISSAGAVTPAYRDCAYRCFRVRGGTVYCGWICSSDPGDNPPNTSLM